MSKLELVSFIEVNKGNSDILVSVIYKKGKDLWMSLRQSKKIPGLERVRCSERIHEYVLSTKKSALGKGISRARYSNFLNLEMVFNCRYIRLQ